MKRLNLAGRELVFANFYTSHHTKININTFYIKILHPNFIIKGLNNHSGELSDLPGTLLQPE